MRNWLAQDCLPQSFREQNLSNSLATALPLSLGEGRGEAHATKKDFSLRSSARNDKRGQISRSARNDKRGQISRSARNDKKQKGQSSPIAPINSPIIKNLYPIGINNLKLKFLPILYTPTLGGLDE